MGGRRTKEDRAATLVELDESDLDAASAGFEAWPCKWKGFSLDGKGTDVAVEEVSVADGTSNTLMVGEKRITTR